MPLVEIRDLSMAYYRDSVRISVLEGVDLDIEKGQFMALMGPSGSGKTTLLNRILNGDHGLRVAVVVNDFGSINVDAELIEGVEDNMISLANGFLLRRSTSSGAIRTIAEAPVLSPGALPAVTVPSLRNALRRVCSDSVVVPWRGYSSVSTTVSPLRPWMVTAVISSSKRPANCACSAFC